MGGRRRLHRHLDPGNHDVGPVPQRGREHPVDLIVEDVVPEMFGHDDGDQDHDLAVVCDLGHRR